MTCMLRTCVLLLGAASCYANKVHEIIATGDDKRLSKYLAMDHRVNFHLHQKDHEGETPIEKATKLGYARMVALLIGRGADASVKDDNDWSLLHHAAHRGHHDMSEMLIHHDNDPHERHADGHTPIDRACKGGGLRHAKMVGNLLRSGAHPGSKEDTVHHGGELPPCHRADDYLVHKMLGRHGHKFHDKPIKPDKKKKGHRGHPHHGGGHKHNLKEKPKEEL